MVTYFVGRWSKTRGECPTPESGGALGHGNQPLIIPS